MAGDISRALQIFRIVNTFGLRFPVSMNATIFCERPALRARSICEI